MKCHTLEFGENKLVVVPERGGIVTELCLQGHNLFYLDQGTLNDLNKNVRGGNPVLFPICGPLVDKTYNYEGIDYQLNQHGFARNLAWQVQEDRVTEAGATITLTLTHNESTLTNFPFEFRLEFTYLLTDSYLLINQIYHNLSLQEMPFYAGFHPYFFADNKDKIQLDVTVKSAQDLINKCNIPFNGMFNINDQAEFNYVLGPVDNKQVMVSGLSGNYNLKISYDAPYRFIVLWTLPNKPFVCVEPWMADNNSMNTGQNVVTLLPDQSLKTSVKYEIIPK